MSNVTIYEGSILDCDVDAIVNPANIFLNHGAGLARIIADAAAGGPPASGRGRVWWQEQRAVPTIATGAVAVTSAGRLPFKGIIHAVGPVWQGGHFFERQLLRSAHDEAIIAALAHKWKSIAFPAISCGLFRFPVDLAAPIAVEAVLAQPELQITFALIEQEHIDAYKECLNARR